MPALKKPAAKTTAISIRFSDAERKLIARAAKLSHLKGGAFVRVSALNAAAVAVKPAV